MSSRTLHFSRKERWVWLIGVCCFGFLVADVATPSWFKEPFSAMLALGVVTAQLTVICAGALGVDDEPILLQGFDEPPLSLFGVLSEEAVFYLPPDHANIRAIFTSEDFSSMGRDWAVASDAATIVVAPVVAVSEGELLPAFSVVLVASVRLSPQQAALAQSLIRRFVLFLQRVVESNRSWSESIQRKQH